MKVKGELLIWKSTRFGTGHAGLFISPTLTDDIVASGSDPEDVRRNITEAVHARMSKFITDVVPGTLTQEPFEVEHEIPPRQD